MRAHRAEAGTEGAEAGGPPLPLIADGRAPADDAAGGRLGRFGATLRRLRLGRALALWAAVFCGAVIGLYFQPPAVRAFFGLTGLEPGGGASRPIAVAPPPPPVAPVTATEVAALGRLKPAGDAVTLAPPFGAGDARIARLLVAEGDAVAAGQAIAELDSLPQLEARRVAAAATLAASEAALAQTRATVAANRTEAEAERDRAAAAADLARSERARVRDLFERGVVPTSALEAAESAATQAARQLDRAEAARARYAGAEAQTDVVLAARQRDVARAGLAEAEGDLARGRVVAPLDGVVLKLHVRPGEKPGAAGVATLGDIDRMRAELEVYQTDVRRLAPGQRVTLDAPALDAPLTGAVERIGLEVERQTIVGDAPAAHTDARVVRVEVALDPDSARRARGFTGLEVVGRIAVGAAP